MTDAAKEKAFEDAIVAHLVDHGGWAQGDPDDYDRERAFLPPDLWSFIEETQPKPWAKVRTIHGDKLEVRFLDALGKDMAQRGSLAVIRHGFKFYGKTFRLAYFAPAHGLNPDVERLYAENRLTLVRQVHYDPSNDNSLDLVLFLNGVPIATVELKNQMTGQSAIVHAQKQYREDRDPNAPIFRFKQRALVHFAVDPDEAWMATRLRGVKTFFLPFNRGHDTSAGNPPVEGKQRTSYLWERVWQRDNFLEVVGRFLHLQVQEETDPATGQKSKKETMIFPRYHQWDCVRRVVTAAREAGAGTNYLVQHSAGSGKSNSIAWLAHRLAFLHDADDSKVFDSVVVLTDRTVLDQQLQDTIYQIDHKRGVVVKVEKGGVKSAKLAKALESGVPIIICTIHSFGFVRDKIASLPDRNYAVIVDEAHSSQSGEMAMTVKEVLSEAQIDAGVAEAIDEDDAVAVDQLALRAAITRGKQDNLSFFAFTATPKYKTLEVFGHKGEDGKPAPFHLYSMRQAIEEGFILDVLQGYTTYGRFYELVKSVADDPELDKRKAARALARFVNLHPTNIAQKTEVIIKHFRSCVRDLLGGRAKAMVVTGSRLEAVRYKQAFDDYLAEQGHTDVRALVAFSGEVKDPDLPGTSYTEPGMNQGIKETELPDQFAGPDYNVLLVANKYQTGFDQPLLCAMYVDKRLSGIQAVQTLSRLNRIYAGKQTFVLDFVNEREEILSAFQQFYQQATIAEPVDPQRLGQLRNTLDEFKVNGLPLIDPAEVDAFAKVYFKHGGQKGVADHGKLNNALDPAVDRFKALKDDEERLGFRAALAAFKNLYGFLAQIVPFDDPDLEKLYAYGRLLLKKLPRTGSGPLDLGDDVALKPQSYQLRKLADGDLELEPGKGKPLKGPVETGTGGKGPVEKLSTIIEIINQRFGTDYDAQDLVDGVTEQLVEDEEVQQAAHANDKANFGFVFKPKLDGALVDRHDKHGKFINAVFEDPAVGELFRSWMLDTVYERVRSADVPSSPDSAVLPFRRVPLAELKPFENAVPLYDLQVAAGRFSSEQIVDEVPGVGEVDHAEQFEWVAYDGRTPPARDLFVAQVSGESMNRRIPNGAYCLWRLHPRGTRQGKVVLAQHRDIHDHELGGHYTVKVYESEKEHFDDGTWRHKRITLKPDSDDPRFEPTVLENVDDGELAIVAGFVEVLGLTE